MAARKVGFGILTWDGAERRSNRYGAITLASEPNQGSARVKAEADLPWLRARRNTRVRLVARIVESRVSTHVGDAGLGIRPPTVAPAVGTTIDIGVGLLEVAPCPFDATLAVIGLRPGDGRRELWLDPRRLYVLHDQTVELFAEPTTDDFTPAPDLACEAGVFDSGDGEAFQVKKTGDSVGLVPYVEKVGAGLFVLTRPQAVEGQFGRRIPYVAEPAPSVTIDEWVRAFWDEAIAGNIYPGYPPAPTPLTGDWVRMAIGECAMIFYECFGRVPTVHERSLILNVLADRRTDAREILAKPPEGVRPSTKPKHQAS